MGIPSLVNAADMDTHLIPECDAHFNAVTLTLHC